MKEDRHYECPLCGTDFTGAECHSSCPVSRGCEMVRCPRCRYEFVESGRLTDMLLRWIRRAPAVESEAKPTDLVPLTEMSIGSTAPIAFIAPTSAARLNRLASYGIVAGTEIHLVSRRPAIVVTCGSATVALEDEIGAEIYITPSAAL